MHGYRVKTSAFEEAIGRILQESPASHVSWVRNRVDNTKRFGRNQGEKKKEDKKRKHHSRRAASADTS